MRARRRFGLRPSRAERDSGAVAVEAAFITPVLLLLVFGMVDLSLLIKDNVSVVSAVRAGARVASTEATLTGTTTSQGYVPGFAADTVATMNRATTNLSREESVTEDPDSGTTAVDGTQLFLSVVPAGATPPDITNSCSGIANCLHYNWENGEFVLVSASWTRGSVNACPISTSTNPDGPDAVRVTLRTPHDFFTPVMSGHWQLGDSAIMNFEPQPMSICESVT